MDVLTLEVLGTHYLIESDRRWRDFLAQLWAPFVVPTSVEGPVDARICDEESGWSLVFSEGWGVEDDDPWSLANEMRNVLFSAVLEANAGKVVALHAAVVERDGAGLLLAGTSGSGKTTLTLELVGRGWTYHSDDLAPIYVDSGMVASFPKPLHVKDLSRWELYRQRWNPPSWVPAPRHTFLVPAVAFEPAPRAMVAPRRLLFPRYDPKEKPRLELYSSARAVAWAAPNLYSSPPLGRAGLDVVIRLCGQADAAEVVYGSAAEGADLIERWVDQSATPVYHVAYE
ncbi:MAG: hypothetical protein H0V23_14480 [Nocardioidaceae bacterium]|nr:hypothetical protein [Nocardioidaceae bacterium]